MKKKDRKIEGDESKDTGYSVSVVNIRYARGKVHVEGRVPEIVTLSIPEGIMRLKKDKAKFEEEVEAFAYNCLSRKYGVEITSCQVFLPLD